MASVLLGMPPSKRSAATASLRSRNASRGLCGGSELTAVIYKANREQIRNPNLIYPGQIFVLPSR
jgi:hypothetical protein